MRRAAVQALRTARRPLVRSLHRGRIIHSHNWANGLNQRGLAARRDNGGQPNLVLSSMYFRNFSVALISTLVASGAFFAYRGKTPTPLEGDVNFPGSSTVSGAFSSPRSTSSNQYSTASPQAISSPIVEEAAERVRRALVVEQGQLYTSTITGEGPLAKDTDDYGRKVLEMMTPEQASQRIRRNESSYLVGRGQGVVRYDVVQLASNDPIEDDHAEKIIELPHSSSPATDAQSSGDWMFWGVFDGHSGWTTSAKLRQALITYVARELNSTYNISQKSTTISALPSPSAIDAAIKRGFVALDNSIVQESVAQVLKTQSKPQAAQLLAPALSGSCALLSFYDSRSKTLRVACTGDSRAVLGRRSTTNTAQWVATPLSVDQTGQNEDEAARLRKEHPDEPGVVRNGRVLGGLEPTRAFGDATYKWSEDIQKRLKKDYFGKTYDARIKTPPYVTAEPVITTTQMQPERGDFVVMATDGLWEMLTNDEVVGLVGQWLEKNPQPHLSGGSSSEQSGADSRSKSWLQSWFSQQKAGEKLPIQQEASSGMQSGQRAPIRQQQWGLPPSTSSSDGTLESSRFVVEDKNVATHLIRNALGGGDRDMVCALLTLPSPYARRYRDDLTVEVIFFGDTPGIKEPEGNSIVVNDEATAKSSGTNGDIKAKL